MQSFIKRVWLIALVISTALVFRAPAAQAQCGSGTLTRATCGGDVCGCASRCSSNSGCTSGCCVGGYCAFACVCRGQGTVQYYTSCSSPPSSSPPASCAVRPGPTGGSHTALGEFLLGLGLLVGTRRRRGDGARRAWRLGVIALAAASLAGCSDGAAVDERATSAPALQAPAATSASDVRGDGVEMAATDAVTFTIDPTSKSARRP